MIVGGAFFDQIGIFQEMDANERCKVLIKLLNAFAILTIEGFCIRKCDFLGRLAAFVC